MGGPSVVAGRAEASIRGEFSARERGERILAATAGVSRLAATGGWLATRLLSEPEPLRHPPLVILITVIAVESTVLGVACLRTGTIRPWWAAADAACIATALYLASLAQVNGASAGTNPVYDLSVFSVLMIGLARWPLPAALSAAALLVVANLSIALHAGDAAYPMWNAIPNSITYPGSATVAWIVAKLVRDTARTLDTHRAAAIHRAGVLARERERVRQGQALGAQLLSTLDDLAVTEGALDSGLREQVRREAGWLRRVVDTGLPEEEGDLAAGLRALVAEKASTGLRVALTLPDEPPVLPPDRAAALIGAAREALTNVGKHAGVGAATVRVTVADGGVEVVVTDEGRGYQTGDGPGGTGQTHSIHQRLSEVDGRAEISSTAGRGTRVRLWVRL
jgi:signal transduction histidine kinase